MAQEYDNIEYMTQKIIEEYRIWSLEVNIDKTQYMFIGGTQQDLTLNTGQFIKRCEEYKYLGINITRDGTIDKTIKERCTQGRKVISLLNNVLWDQGISKDNKKRIYKTIIKSIVTYSSEKRSENMLLTTEMDFWRKSAGKSRRERIRNERIRKIMNVNTIIIEDIRTNQLRWYGHVLRMQKERLSKQILLWTL